MSYLSITTMNKKLEKIVPVHIARFIKYYYTDPDKRLPWDEFKTCNELIKAKTYEECLPWLEREDAQKALQLYHKENKLLEQTKLYDAMYKKALDGDTRAADWVMKYYQSDYFDDSNDEIDDFLNGVDIPALKGV